MNANQNELLTALMEAEFACVELNLFLDTHPDDAGAQAAFAAQSQRLRELKARYEREVSPLLNFGYSPSTGENWVSATPWPWECK